MITIQRLKQTGLMKKKSNWWGNRLENKCYKI